MCGDTPPVCTSCRTERRCQSPSWRASWVFLQFTTGCRRVKVTFSRLHDQLRKQIAYISLLFFHPFLYFGVNSIHCNVSEMRFIVQLKTKAHPASPAHLDHQVISLLFVLMNLHLRCRHSVVSPLLCLCQASVCGIRSEMPRLLFWRESYSWWRSYCRRRSRGIITHVGNDTAVSCTFCLRHSYVFSSTTIL